MRYALSLFILVALLFSQSCKDGDATNNSPASPTATTNNSLSPQTSTTGVEHYICPNGHAGKGGAAAGTCSECGATLEHNAAFHNNEPQTNDLANQETVDPNAGVNPDVEHYICPNGHVGSGGAAAGQCAECGAELTHNDTYHTTPPPADLVNQVNNIDPAAAATQTSAPAGVEHYICPNGHVGSGGPGEGTCSQCQAALVHNDAFHNSPTAAPNGGTNVAAPEQIIPQPSGAVSPVFQNAGTPAGVPTVGSTAPGLEPAQNASGVWHYVCPDGHAGGAGSEQACSQCGKTLVHNTAYHQ